MEWVYKACTLCKKVLPPEKFGTDNKGKNLRGRCVSCRAKTYNNVQRSKRQSNFEKMYEEGNRNIGYCKCGRYFVMLHPNRVKPHIKCYHCRREK